MGMIGGGGGGGGGGAPDHASMKHGGKGAAGVDMGSLIQSAFGSALGGGGGGGGGGAAGLLQGLISNAVGGAGGGHGQGGGNAASGNMLGTIIGALAGGKNMSDQSSVTKGGSGHGRHAEERRRPHDAVQPELGRHRRHRRPRQEGLLLDRGEVLQPQGKILSEVTTWRGLQPGGNRLQCEYRTIS